MEQNKSNEFKSQEDKSPKALSWLYGVQNKMLLDIGQAQDPQFIAELPLVMAGRDDLSVLNMVVADAGAGKSLLSRAIAQYVLGAYDDVILLWIDLEYSNVVAKQRNMDSLLMQYSDRCFIVTQEQIAELREAYKKRNINVSTTAGIINRLIEAVKQETNKRLFVIVDSFEDFIDDTSNDTEVKRHLFKMLEMRGVTYLINHHVNKDNAKSSAMRFRGSMVIKAKLTSLLMIAKKEKENDEVSVFELLLLKIRTAYKPVSKIVARINTSTWDFEGIELTSDLEEIKILKAIYFMLMKADGKQMLKTALIEAVAKEIKKHKDKVRAVLDKNIRYFDVVKGDKRAENIKLSGNVDVLDELCSKLGITNNIWSKAQVELWKEVSDMNDSDEINIRLRRDGGIVEYRLVKTLKNYISSLSDDEVNEILQQLRAKKVSPSKVNEIEQVDEKELDMIIEGGF